MNCGETLVNQTLPSKLLAYKSKIESILPHKQSIRYDLNTWRRQFGWNENLEQVAKACPCPISRTDLFQLSAQAGHTRNIEDILNLFLGVMQWGYGTAGYGAWRTHQMISTSGSRQTLQVTFEFILDNEIELAYRKFNLDRCGPPFFTKFFYFAGFGNKVPKYPLILDTRVYERLKDQIGVDVDRFVKRSSWCWPEGYVRYVNTIHDWAAELGCEAHNIELFLFNLR